MLKVKIDALVKSRKLNFWPQYTVSMSVLGNYMLRLKIMEKTFYETIKTDPDFFHAALFSDNTCISKSKNEFLLTRCWYWPDYEFDVSCQGTVPLGGCPRMQKIIFTPLYMVLFFCMKTRYIVVTFQEVLFSDSLLVNYGLYGVKLWGCHQECNFIRRW